MEEALQLAQELEDLLANLPNSIVRIKGLVRFKETPDKLFLLQRVGRRFSIMQHCSADTQDQVSRLLVLGNVEMPNERELQHWFTSILAS